MTPVQTDQLLLLSHHFFVLGYPVAHKVLQTGGWSRPSTYSHAKQCSGQETGALKHKGEIVCQGTSDTSDRVAALAQSSITASNMCMFTGLIHLDYLRIPTVQVSVANWSPQVLLTQGTGVWGTSPRTCPEESPSPKYHSSRWSHCCMHTTALEAHTYMALQTVLDRKSLCCLKIKF